MRIRALVSFSGALSMYKGQEIEFNDKEIIKDLLRAEYIEEVKPEKPKKDVKSNESKRNNSK